MASYPPPVLDGIRILQFAIVGPPVQFTGRLRLNVGGQWLGAVPRLAVGRDLATNELVLLHCDAHWTALGVQAWNDSSDVSAQSAEDVMKRAEGYYAGLMPHWRVHPATEVEALEYQAEKDAELTCSFCGQLAESRLLEKGSAKICARCVEKFHEEIHGGRG